MADLNFQLLDWQREVLSDKTRFKVVVAGRRCGKSRLAATLLLIKGLECPAGSHVMYVAPTQGQARVIIWQMLLDLGYGVITGSHVNNMEVYLPNGTIIYVRGADRPDTLRGGDLYFLVIDEYADIKPIVWEQVLRASLARHQGSALFIGTPKGRNHFYDIYKLGESGEDQEWKSWHFTTKDNELIDPKEIEAAKKTLSSFSFKQEYLASFDNAGTDLFKEEWLKYGEEPKIGSWYISVDLAGFEAISNSASNAKKRLDQTAISIVKATDEGKWWVKNIEYGRWDVRETAVRILKNIREYRPLGIGIEKTSLMNAVMPYLTDLMRKNNVYAHIIPLTHGNRTKYDRILWALQGMFEHGRIILNANNDWDEFKDQYLMYPTKNVHDDCFPANAPIITMDGIKPIQNITTDDYVLTRNGYKRVLKAWCKGNKKTITRYGITATPEHKIYTANRGWVELDSLCDDDIILESNAIERASCEKQLNSMAENITGIQTQNNQTIGNIIHAMTNGYQAQDFFIGIFGNSITEESQKTIMSTILMEMPITIRSKILNACLAQRIMSNIEMKDQKEGNQKNNSSIWEISEISLKNGIRQKKEVHGIENIAEILSCEIFLKNNVQNAEIISNQKYPDNFVVQNNAHLHAPIEKQEKEEPVYDLMVEDNHEFFAFGVLVHNCMDSLAYISQMAVTSYMKEDENEEEWEPIDIISGL